MNQTQRTLQEYRTTLPPADVIAAAKRFFTSRSNIYASFIERESPSHVTFRGQGNEELVIGAVTMEGVTLVTGGTYLYDMQIARFFTTLPPWDATEALLPPGPAAIQAPDMEVRP